MGICYRTFRRESNARHGNDARRRRTARIQSLRDVLLDGGYERRREGVLGKTAGEFSGEIRFDVEVGFALSYFEIEKSQRANPIPLKSLIYIYASFGLSGANRRIY